MNIEQSRKLALENAIETLSELNAEDDTFDVTELVCQLLDVITEKVSA